MRYLVFCFLILVTVCDGQINPGQIDKTSIQELKSLLIESQARVDQLQKEQTAASNQIQNLILVLIGISLTSVLSFLITVYLNYRKERMLQNQISDLENVIKSMQQIDLYEQLEINSVP